jgi:branched-chain amino acid transport system substrate-binding protein
MTARKRVARAPCCRGVCFAVSATNAQAKIKVGFMLPYTGTYAALGVAIENGFRLYVQEQGGKLGGRELEYFKVDDESSLRRPSTTSTS